MKFLRNILLIIIVGYVVIPILLIIFDLINIRDIIPLTDNYDWIAFIGGYMSGLSALIISYITVIQNEKLAELNQNTLEESIISNNYFRILFREEQIVENNIYKMKIFEKDKIPLKSVQINSIIIQKYDGKKYNVYKDILAEKGKGYELEYTDNANRDGKEDFYYAFIDVDLKKDELTSVENYYKMIIEMQVKNIHNVEITYSYSIILKMINSGDNIIKFKLEHSFEYIKKIEYVR